IETVNSDPRIPNRWIFDRQNHTPQFLSVLCVNRKHVTGMIAGFLTAHDELRVERINNRSVNVAVHSRVPALRAVRVQGKELTQVLHEIVSAIASNVSWGKDIEGIRG